MPGQNTIDPSVGSQEIYIPREMRFAWDSSPYPCGVKDTHSRYIYANNAFLKLLSLSVAVDGLSDNNLPYISSLSKKLIKVERLVLKKKQPVSLFCVLKSTPLLLDICPFFNRHGNVVGTHFRFQRALHLSMEFYLNPEGKDVTLFANPPSKILTETEWSIVFLFLQRKTQKEISSILQLSEKAVNHRISYIIGKLGLDSVFKLRSFCEKVGWVNYIPLKFLTQSICKVSTISTSF